jgi:methionyl-tRNA synthetase
MYLTTPIYYVNGAPHIGHAHTSVMADIIKRWRSQTGLATFLTTGVDEHGQKNEECAKAAGLEPQQYLDQQAATFKALFDKLGVQYDHFVRTTEPYHKMAVVAALEELQKQFVKRDYTGLYCVGCEQFKKASDLNSLGQCPDHLRAPEERTETNWFFPLEPYRELLQIHMEVNPDWIQPEQYANEVRRMLEHPLEDLCISRPKTRLKLGIELPFDHDYVTYVWFDALLNYLSNIEWPLPRGEEWPQGYQERWADSHHLIGKDIVKTHCVYWPIMLMALGETPPKSIQVHAHWLGKGRVKMAKSLGNVVDPNEVIDESGVDALRYYLARRMSTTHDTEITKEHIAEVYNDELANGVGNLLSRSAKLYAKEFGAFTDDGVYDPIIKDLEFALRLKCQTMDDIPFYTEAIKANTAIIDAWFTDQAPWTLIKQGKRSEAELVLRSAIRAVVLLLWHLEPICPEGAMRGLAMLGAGTSPGLPMTQDFTFEIGQGLFQRLV